MDKVHLASPWVCFYREIEALFGNDPEIKIQYDEDNNVVKLFVDNSAKADALVQLLPSERKFGNVTIYVEVLPADGLKDTKDLIKTAFEGNPALAYIKTMELFAHEVTYVVFKKEVVQFYDDDLSDIHGNRSTLYQDLARDLFDVQGIFFCTE